MRWLCGEGEAALVPRLHHCAPRRDELHERRQKGECEPGTACDRPISTGLDAHNAQINAAQDRAAARRADKGDT